ncbi:hypothetical protein MAM1_0177c07312 [Mucor ambiguus]|uniref:HTH CENPB-type domain-containing protein n=1 Tax=Mucor ambiguus TaxID=91626 RepID=A0A0C9MZV0_9FUNG|nr:hypothetical protein MAM1_0177c07312 [Mucor ambiguus]
MTPTDSIKNSRNIHVFRVNRSVKTKERYQSNTNTKPAAVNSRTSLSAETKRLICEDHNINPKYTQEALAKKYGCKRTTVAKIIKSKERWLSIASDAAIAKRFRQRNSRYPLVENALVLWLEKEDNLASITDQMLRYQARQYAQAFSTEGSIGSEDFKASSSWVANFKQRYLIPKLAKLESQSLKSDSNHVPESIEIRDQYRGTYGNSVHNFTSVFSVGPPLPTKAQHVHIPSSDPTSNSIDSNTTLEEWGPESKDSPVEDDDTSIVSSHARAKHDQDRENSSTEQDEEFDRAAADYTDDFDEPQFRNDTVEASATMQTQQKPHDNQTTESMTQAPSPSPSPSPSLSQPNNPKLSAKEHLEAALAFYTSQNDSSTSMSANMIKLILQNDFV